MVNANVHEHQSSYGCNVVTLTNAPSEALFSIDTPLIFVELDQPARQSKAFVIMQVISNATSQPSLESYHRREMKNLVQCNTMS